MIDTTWWEQHDGDDMMGTSSSIAAKSASIDPVLVAYCDRPHCHILSVKLLRNLFPNGQRRGQSIAKKGPGLALMALGL